MRSEYTIPLSQIEKEFSLERVTVPENYESILIATPEVWRPGLALAGFYDIFDKDRISIIGNAEHVFLSRLEPEDRKKKIIAPERTIAKRSALVPTPNSTLPWGSVFMPAPSRLVSGSTSSAGMPLNSLHRSGRLVSFLVMPEFYQICNSVVIPT